MRKSFTEKLSNLEGRAVQRKRLTVFNASGWTSADDWLYNGLSGID